MNRTGGLPLPSNDSRVPATDSFSPGNPQEPTTNALNDPVNYEDFGNEFGPEVTPFDLPAALQSIAEWEALQDHGSGSSLHQQAPHSLDSFDPSPPIDPFRDLPSFDSGHYDDLPDPYHEFVHPHSPVSSGDFDFGFDTTAVPDAAGPEVRPAGVADAKHADAQQFQAESNAQQVIDSDFASPLEQQPGPATNIVDSQLPGSDLAVPQHSTSPQGSQVDGSEYDSFSDEEQTSRRAKAAPGHNEDPSKQCEYKASCRRPGRSIAGRFNGRKLCRRHGDQWETKNAGPPSWRPLVVSTEAAMAAIRPNIRQPAEYRRQGYQDKTLHAHRDGHVHWTVRFHQAAMTPYHGEGDGHADPYKLLPHQSTFEEKAASKRHNKDYCEAMIVARISLLFPIALRYHVGGPAIYCTGGDNSGYFEEPGLNFLERLQLMEEKLRLNKRVVMDVIEGRGVEAFVRGPSGFDKRKRSNKKGNIARQERNSGTQPNSAPQSRQPSIGIGEAGPAPRPEDDEAIPPVSTAAPKAKAVGRKRRRLAKEENDDDFNGQEQKVKPAPKQKRAPRKCPVISAASPRLPTASHSPQQRALSFGPTMHDRRMFYGQPPDPIDDNHAYVQQASRQPTAQRSQAFGGLPGSSTPQPFHPGAIGFAEPQFRYPPPQAGGSSTAYHVPSPRPPHIRRPEQQLSLPPQNDWQTSQQYAPALIGQPALEYRGMLHGLDMAFGHHGANSGAAHAAGAAAATAPPRPTEQWTDQRALGQGRQQGIPEVGIAGSGAGKPVFVKGQWYANMGAYNATLQRH